MDHRFWDGKEVLVTGHTGFKGSWLCLWLHQLGARVSGYSLAPAQPSLYVDAGLNELIDSHEGDIRDRDRLGRVVRSARPDVIFHMAAQSLVRASYEDPAGTFEVNVMGTVNVLEAAREAEAGAVVNVTSDKCYENPGDDQARREGDPLGGSDPYSASKACAELVGRAYDRSFFARREPRVAHATARAGNVIGGGDWGRDRLVPDFVRAAMQSRPLLVRHPGATRPWQYVLDPLRGYLMLAEALAREGTGARGAWNFGPGPEASHTVAWVADHLVRLWGEGAGWTQDGGKHPPEAATLRLDASKAHTGLGWTPRTDVASALARSVALYKAEIQGDDIRSRMGHEIRTYQEATPRP